MTDPLTIAVAAVFGVGIVVIVVLVGSTLYLLAETGESWLRRWWTASRHVAWRDDD